MGSDCGHSQVFPSTGRSDYFFPHAQTLTIHLSPLSSLWERFGSHSLLEDYDLSIQDTHRPCSLSTDGVGMQSCG